MHVPAVSRSTGHHRTSSAACTQNRLLDHDSSKKNAVNLDSSHASRSAGFLEMRVSPDTMIHCSFLNARIQSTSVVSRGNRSERCITSIPCALASSAMARAIATEIQLSRKNLTEHGGRIQTLLPR